MANTTEVPEAKETTDVRTQRVAKVYAEALYAAAQSAGQMDVVLEEIESLVRDVIDRDPRLSTMLTSAALGRDARAAALAKAFKGRASQTLYAFLQVLNSHERLELVRPIAWALRELNEERARRVRVYVTSAAALGGDEVAKIAAVVKQQFHLEPIMIASVDPALLGGVKIRVGDKQYDASVRTRIENLKNQILTSSSHEIQSRRDRFSSAV